MSDLLEELIAFFFEFQGSTQLFEFVFFWVLVLSCMLGIFNSLLVFLLIIEDRVENEIILEKVAIHVCVYNCITIK